MFYSVMYSRTGYGKATGHMSVSVSGMFSVLSGIDFGECHFITNNLLQDVGVYSYGMI